MTREQRYIVELSKAAIFDEVPSMPPKDLDWEYVFNKAQEQNITGLIANAIWSLPSENQPENIYEWRNIIMQTIAIMTGRTIEFERMINILKEKDVKPVCLKGCVVKDLYPEPTLRVMGDFDIWIEKSERKRVEEIFRKEGYEIENKPLLIYASKNRVNWEIFDSLEEEIKADTGYWENRLRENTCVNPNGGYQLNPTCDFAYTALHAAKHFLNRGCGIRPLLDLALMIKKYDNIDFAFAGDLCESQGMEKVLHYIYNAINEFFGLNIDFEYESLDAGLFMEYILQYGIFGRDKDVQGTAGYVFNKDNSGGAIRQMLFPSAKALSETYPYLKKFPVLLPIVWIKHGARSVFVNKRSLKHVIMILKSGVSLKKEKDDWFNRLGLKEQGK